MKQAAEDWSPNRVLYELREKGLSLRALAAQHGIHVSGLSQALYDRYPKAEARISRALGLRPDQIWPSRYRSRRKGATR
ncbi:MAG: helix-turn-helix domain-containing protein [Candidatus Binatus sp.]